MNPKGGCLITTASSSPGSVASNPDSEARKCLKKYLQRNFLPMSPEPWNSEVQASYLTAVIHQVTLWQWFNLTLFHQVITIWGKLTSNFKDTSRVIRSDTTNASSKRWDTAILCDGWRSEQGVWELSFHLYFALSFKVNYSGPWLLHHKKITTNFCL